MGKDMWILDKSYYSRKREHATCLRFGDLERWVNKNYTNASTGVATSTQTFVWIWIKLYLKRQGRKYFRKKKTQQLKFYLLFISVA